MARFAAPGAGGSTEGNMHPQVFDQRSAPRLRSAADPCWLDNLRSVAPAGVLDPTIGVMTPGMVNSA
jgi:uncharacterized circularly permuted ATP-grasp superfamily protein